MDDIPGATFNYNLYTSVYCDKFFNVTGSCFNNDLTTDSAGNTCTSAYDNNNALCGTKDSTEFLAATQCCACGGGVSPDVSYDSSSDELTI